MKFFRVIRSRFGLKIFTAFMIVTLVGIGVMATGARLISPATYNRYQTYVARANNLTPPQTLPTEGNELFNYFQAAITEALGVALVVALIIAVLVSLIVSRLVVAPVREMMTASQHIADGHYNERVRVHGNVRTGELDELAQLALSFNQMASRLEKTEQFRRQLIGDVAHELRTPLTTIKGSLEGLIDGVLPGDIDTYHLLYQETDRMQRLVDDLQELSRVEARAYEMNPQSASIAQLVAIVKERLDRQFIDKGVELIVDIPPTLPGAQVDELRILQVLTNLIGNALQFTPSGGKVIVCAEQRADQVIVSVQDNGIGLAPDQLKLIFTRFYRVDKSRARLMGGSGIGLTIAEYLVEAHGGRIWAESPGLGKGSTFRFSLPLASVKAV